MKPKTTYHGYRISNYFKRVTVWTFNADGGLESTSIFIPNKGLCVVDRKKCIIHRLSIFNLKYDGKGH